MSVEYGICVCSPSRLTLSTVRLLAKFDCASALLNLHFDTQREIQSARTGKGEGLHATLLPAGNLVDVKSHGTYGLRCWGFQLPVHGFRRDNRVK